MSRKLFLVFAILAVFFTPGPAHGGGGQHGGHHHRHHSHHFIGLIYGPFPYGPPCWEEGHWIDQHFVDRFGNSTYVPLWVPPHWGCWY